MLSFIRDLVRKIRSLSPGYARPVVEAGLRNNLLKIDRMAVELLRLNILSAPRYQNPRQLARYGFKAYSQYDEDGLLDEIFRRVGVTNRFFVEFGVGDGIENNTQYRLAGGWRGVWIEGSPVFSSVIRTVYQELISTSRLRLVESFITAESIEQTFADSGVPPEFNLLSIDIDGNDYWVWRAITSYKPRVVVIEYNAGIGPTIPWAMPYQADFVGDGSRAFGASLKALELLGRTKGYELVGCGISGVNAFFVRSDLLSDQFLNPFDSATHFEPPRYYLVPFPGHTPSQREVAAITAGPPNTDSSNE